jgi:tRNA(Ile)-lysidine synthase
MLARAPALSIKPLLEPLLQAIGHAPGAPMVVAVSGGGDSLALLLLAHEAYPGRIHAVTVDHALREGSAAEAERIARWSSAHGIPHRTLRWKGAKPIGAIQKRAREARYGLLAQAACEVGSPLRPAPVLAAHTLEDQAETFAMRLAHASGLAGLSAMHAVSEIAGAPPVPLLRPLLKVPRADLRAYLRARGQPWIEDPSNEDLRFERIRIRRAIGASLPPAADLARAAALFARLEDAAENPLQSFLREAVRIEPEGFARADAGAIAAAHPITLSRVLARLIRAVGGGAYPPPRAAVDALVAKLQGSGFSGATLGGCRLMAHAGEWVFVREQRGIGRNPIRGGEPVFWDRRFFVHSPPGWPALTVGPLGRAGAGLRDRLPAGVLAAALAALPGLYEGERLLAAALPGALEGNAPVSRFAGLARVERRLCREWAAWAPAQISPTVS